MAKSKLPSRSQPKAPSRPQPRSHSGPPGRPVSRPRSPSRSPSHPPAQEVLYGINPVEAALGAGKRKLHQLYLREGRLSGRQNGLAAQAGQAGVPTSQVPSDDLSRLVGNEDHQGVGLACGPLPTLTEQDALTPAEEPGGGRPGQKTTAKDVQEPAVKESQNPRLLVALDEVQDPRNLGAILRCCAVFGVDGLVVTRHHASPHSPTASKASAGFLETFPVHVAANLAKFLDLARERGYWIAGAEQEGETPLHTFRRDQPLVVVMGNEGRGLRPLVRKKCDFHLAIKTPAGGSLNVSAAAAVLLYQLTLPA